MQGVSIVCVVKYVEFVISGRGGEVFYLCGKCHAPEGVVRQDNHRRSMLLVLQQLHHLRQLHPSRGCKVQQLGGESVQWQVHRDDRERHGVSRGIGREERENGGRLDLGKVR